VREERGRPREEKEGKEGKGEKKGKRGEPLQFTLATADLRQKGKVMPTPGVALVEINASPMH